MDAVGTRDIETLLLELSDAVVSGRQDDAVRLTGELVEAGAEAQRIMDGGLLAGISVVGAKFKANELYVPEVLIAGRAMQGAFERLERLTSGAPVGFAGKAVIGTVKGDLHDIGKNLVIYMMKGAGIQVFDLGIDVAPEDFLTKAAKEEADLLCMSALLTTTMPRMRTVVQELLKRDDLKHLKVMIGGAPVTWSYADEIGADGYAPDAATAVDLALELIRSKPLPVRIVRQEQAINMAEALLAGCLPAVVGRTGLTDPVVSLVRVPLPGTETPVETKVPDASADGTLRIALRQGGLSIGSITFQSPQAPPGDGVVPALARKPGTPSASVSARPQCADEAAGGPADAAGVLEIVQENIVALDVELHVVYANRVGRRAIERLTGARAGWHGRKCHDVYFASHAPCPDCPAQEAINLALSHADEADRVRVHRVVSRSHPVLGPMSLDVSAVPLLDGDGKPEMVIVTRRDETLRAALATVAREFQGVDNEERLVRKIAVCAIDTGSYEAQVWRRVEASERKFRLAARTVLEDGRAREMSSTGSVVLEEGCWERLNASRYLWTLGQKVRLNHYPDLRDFIASRGEAVVSSPLCQAASLRPRTVAIHLPIRAWEDLWAVVVVSYDLSQRILTTGQLETFVTFADFLQYQVGQRAMEELRVEQLRAVVHHARKPINAVMGLVDLVKNMEPGEGQDRIADVIRSALELASAKLLSMATVWHAEKGSIVQPRLIECDLRDVAEDTLALFVPRAADEAVYLSLDKPGRPVPAVTDPEAIHHILMELIDNSLRWFASRTENKRVLVEILPASEPGGWQLLVNDNGSGFDEYTRAHAFEVEPSTGRSTGLGLPGVATLVSALGGEIEVLERPRLGSGSTVAIRLPPGE